METSSKVCSMIFMGWAKFFHLLGMMEEEDAPFSVVVVAEEDSAPCSRIVDAAARNCAPRRGDCHSGSRVLAVARREEAGEDASSVDFWLLRSGLMDRGGVGCRCLELELRCL